MNNQSQIVIWWNPKFLLFEKFDQILGRAQYAAVKIAYQLATMDVSLVGAIPSEIGNQNYIAVFDFAEAILKKVSN
jgi:hypothetical protein